jgi:hypothetical protein
MTRLIFFLFLSTMVTSCYSYKIFPREYRDYVYSGEKQTAFIINPELKKEREILKQSGIFIFTDDSLSNDCLKIKLHPLERKFSCGEPILASVITLGQLPVYFPDRYRYQFDEVYKSDTTTRSFELMIAQRTWFWDMFVIHKNFKQKAGKALLANYYKQTAPSSGPLTKL